MTSGLLAKQSGKVDYDAATSVTDAVARVWNEKFARTGITLYTSRSAVEHICDLGKDLFASGAFADMPGPYKRVAAFTVLARLFPVFKPIFAYPESPEGAKAWEARFVLLSMASCMEILEAVLDGETVALPPWLGFPSLHYRLEFLTWIRWLDFSDGFGSGTGESAEWRQFQHQRLARMVMATSLIIEAAHYAGDDGKPKPVQGRTASCFRDLDEETRLDLFFDKI